MMQTPSNRQTSDEQVLRQLKRLSRRGFAASLAGMAGAIFGIRWVATQEPSSGLSWPLRSMHRFNEQLWHDWFGTAGRAPEFPLSQAREPRPNGMYGLVAGDGTPISLDAGSWRLRVESDTGEFIEFSLDDIKSLPRVEQVTEFKCIEGWSQIVAWAGCRFSDLMNLSKRATRSGTTIEQATASEIYPYVSLSTPNGDYYVGIDASSAAHPQSLLAYEMNGAPLTSEHGAPLRLVIPVKYGIKNIKRIGVIRFTDDRPADFWAERGYDWYAGL